MTIENDTSKKVSNEQLLVDIENTEKENVAYFNLNIAYQVLSDLPENKGAKAYEYEFLSRKFGLLEKECSEFLKTLRLLRKERRI